MLAFFVLNTLVVLATVMLSTADHRALSAASSWPVIFPAAALAAVIAAWWFVRQGRQFQGLPASRRHDRRACDRVAAGLFPNLLISTINPAYNLTIFNAASQPTR